MSRIATLKKIAATGAAASIMSIGVAAVAAAPVSAAGKASCSAAEFDPKLDAAVHSCEISGGSVEIMYNFKCMSIPKKSENVAVTWKNSESRVIKNPCGNSTAYGITYKIL